MFAWFAIARTDKEIYNQSPELQCLTLVYPNGEPEKLNLKPDNLKLEPQNLYHEYLGRHFSFCLFVCCWEVQHYATINPFAYVWFGVTPLAMHHLLDDHCTCRGILSTQGSIITCQSFPSTPINALITLIFNYWHLVDVGTRYWVLVTEYCILGLDTEYWVLSTGHWVVGIFAVKSKVSLLKDRVPLITIWFFKHSKIHPFTIFTIGQITFGLESLFKKITSYWEANLCWEWQCSNIVSKGRRH